MIHQFESALCGRQFQESKLSVGGNSRQQRPASQADSVSNWRRPPSNVAAAAAAPGGVAGVSAPSPDKWRGGGGVRGSGRRPPRGAGEGGVRRLGFQSANGDMAGSSGSSAPPAAASTAAANLDTFDLQRLDPCVQKLLLLLTSPPDPDRAPATVRALWRANCSQALAELQAAADQGPDSEVAQRVLSPDAVAILLQLLPRLQPGDEAPVGPLQALLAGALIGHKITPAEPLTLATVRHLLSRLANADSSNSIDAKLAGAHLQLLAALCLNVGQFSQHQGLLRDTVRRLVDRLARWPVLGDVEEVIDEEYSSSACQFYAAQALANLAYVRPTDQRDCLPADLVTTLMSRCLALLESAGAGASARVLQLLLHLLTFLISRSPPIRPADLPRLLNQLRRFLWHGLPSPTSGASDDSTPTPAFAREPELDQFDSVTVPGIRSKKPLKKARCVARGDGGDSDEEASGSLEQRLSGLDLRDADLADLMLNRDERQPQAASDSLADAKVRFISGSCLRRLVESLHKRALQCHWLAFFPDPGRPSFLLALLLREPNSRVRANLLDLLASLFHGSKAFLLLAEDFGVPKTAFTPLSTRLAGSLREMHRQILQALLAERSQATQAQLLRCIGQLAGNVPYQKLRPGLVTKIFKVASPFLLSESPDVKSAALQCFGQLASLEGPAFEVSHCLLQDCLRSPAASPMLTGFHTPLLGPQTAPFESSWLVQHCLRVAHPGGDGWQSQTDDALSASTASAAGAAVRQSQQQQPAVLEPTSVRVEALATLRWLVLRYWNFVSPVAEQLRRTLQLCLLPESNRAVRAASVRALDALLTSLPPAEAAATVWPAFLPCLLACLQPAAHYSVRSAAAECLALLDDASSSGLPSELLGQACQALLNLCQDGLNTVRAAAVRALGAWTSLSPIRAESNGQRLLALVWRFADLCNGIESLVVRAQAAWSLAQASEALLAMSADPTQSRRLCQPLLSEPDLVRLFLAGMNLCADAPKVRENAARLLGNLFCLAASAGSGGSGGHLRASMEQAATGLANLVTPGGADSASARVRWNASLAIRCAFGRLPVGEPWTLCLHSALFDALRSDKYFKVKIHAACALLTLQERRQFGDPSTSEQQRRSGNPMARLVGSVIGCARHVRAMDIPFSEQTHKTVLDYLLCLLLLRASALLLPADASAVSPLLLGDGNAAAVNRADDVNDAGNDDNAEIQPMDLLASQLSRLWPAQAALAWDSGAQVRQAFFLSRAASPSTSNAAVLLEPEFAAEALNAAEANLTNSVLTAVDSGASECARRLLELVAGARSEQALHATSLTSAFRQTYD